MSYCAYILLVFGAMISLSMAVEEYHLLQTSFDKAITGTAGKKGQNETHIEEYFTSAEKDNIVRTINDLRRTVGAADMTYLDWSDAMENDASTFTAQCNYDVWIVTNGWGLKQYSSAMIDPVATLKKAFPDARFHYGMSSVYLLGIGVNIRLCSSAIVNGVHHSNIYIAGYFFSHASLFNDDYAQYSLGTACTKCRSCVFWCDGGLCRDDCNSQISTCSCFTDCSSCPDWNRSTCTCPYRPTTDAVTLNCTVPNKGETAYKAEASMAMIVMSTLVLFYPQ